MAVGLDVRGRTLAARGWTRDGGDLYDVLARLDSEGCARYVVTDVNKDGMLQGPNLDLLRAVCAATDRPVVASGGITELADLAALQGLVADGVEGAIIGTALYEGRFTLEDALALDRPAAVGMSLAVRVIPCLDVDAGRVVKGVNFQGLRDAGDPVELAKKYDAEGADELTFLDISASHEGRATTMEIVSAHRRAGVHPAHRRRRRRQRGGRRPAAAGRGRQGGGEHRRDPPARAGRRDRRPLRQPGAGALGRRPPRRRHRRAASRSPPTAAAGAPASTRSTWARRAAELGAGEILLNAMDADGTRDGFDLDLIRLVRAEVSIPVIASGGAGAAEHFPPAVEAGADAVLAASVFHFGTLRVGDVKALPGRRRPPRPLTPGS